MRPFFELAREAGVDVQAELRKAGWSEAELLRPDVQMEREESVDLFRLIRRLYPDPLIGLRAAARFDPADVDVLGFLLMHCEHALAAIEAMGRYARLLGDAVVSEVERVEGRVVLRLGLSGGRTQLPEVVDYHAGAVHVMLSRLSDHGLRPIQVWLARPRPADVRPYGDFFDAPVRFDAVMSTLTYREADALVPFAGASARLKQILAEHAAGVIERYQNPDGLVGCARALVDQSLGVEEPSARTVARALGLSERTLRRRLRDERTGFRELVDDVRRERALVLVRDSDLNVSELAHRCGFSDGAAFARAFKRWTGHSPARVIRASRTPRPDGATGD
jgi:AraC-like DNA-binding protein